jgi:choline dehydrogenase-like flavoprotein
MGTHSYDAIVVGTGISGGWAAKALTEKGLTLLGFFTSRPGATQVLQYVATPGAYHGCLPVNQAGNGRRWAIWVPAGGGPKSRVDCRRGRAYTARPFGPGA